MDKKIENITPYGNDNSKKGQVTNMFDSIAPYYDYLNRFLSLGIDVWWRKRAIDLITDHPTKNVLDVATGTADLAISIAKRVKPTSVIGMDISSKMLEVGTHKIKKQQLSQIVKLELGDSENLKYQDGQFDLVTAAFGVRNFENLAVGLAEMHRVLGPKGQMMILEFSRPTSFPIKNMFNAYFKYLLPVIGKVKSKDPKAYKYLYESVQAFPDYDKFSDILKNIGFKSVTYKPLSFGICTIYLAKK